MDGKFWTKRERKTFVAGWVLLVLSTSIDIGCTNIGLNGYTPKTDDEKQIISLLKEYQTAKNLHDIERLLACLHEDGHFQFMGGSRVSKMILANWAPHVWSRFKAGQFPDHPINHEQITGDFFPTGRLMNPRITINNNVADIVVTYTTGGWWWQKHFITAINTGRGWKIMKLEWEQI